MVFSEPFPALVLVFAFLVVIVDLWADRDRRERLAADHRAWWDRLRTATYSRLMSDAGLASFGGDDAAPSRFRLICFRAETEAPPVLWRPPPDVAAPDSGSIAITSACHSNLARGTIGLGYVPVTETESSGPFIDPSGQFWKVHEVPKPFYDRLKQRPRGDWN